MNSKQLARLTAKCLAATAGFAATVYGTYVGATWLRYGKPARAAHPDALLDIFMPDYDVVERHRVHIAAPPDVALAAATETDLDRGGVIRGIFKARQWILRGKPDNVVRPQGMIAAMKSIGWSVLAELPGREIVMGGVTKPWEANPEFGSLPPDEFASFAQPDYVKIVWTLRAVPDGYGGCVFSTETRATATDAQSRKKFRLYWSFLSPGIITIRRVLLPAVKAEAERRTRRLAA
jgi:hypothetical protein